MKKLVDWLKRAETVLLPNAAVPADATAAPPTVAAKLLLGTTAHGMNELVADEVLGAGGFTTPAVAATAPVPHDIAQRSAHAAQNTLDIAEGTAKEPPRGPTPHPSQVPAPKSYIKRLHGDIPHLPEEIISKGR